MTMPIRKRAGAAAQPALYIIACAWCGKVRQGETWRRQRRQPPGSQVSHGICPECFGRQVARLGQQLGHGD